jgi:hypothetical protein
MGDETDSSNLPTLTRRLYEQYGPAAPTYQSVWAAVASGRIPAQRRGRGYEVLDSDWPVVLAHFGLTPSPSPTPPTPASSPDKAA